MLFFQTAYQNIYRFWVADYVGGDVIVSKNARAYDFLHPLPLERDFDFRKFINHNPAFKEKVSPCLRVGAMLASKTSGNSLYCVVSGIDLRDKKGFTKQLSLFEGRMFDAHRNEVVLPREVAYSLDMQLGDYLVIYVKTKDGYQNFDLFKVVGYLNISLPARTFYSQTMVYMSLAKLRDLVTVDSDRVSEIIVLKKPGLFGAPLRGDFQRISGYISFSQIRSLFYAFCFMEIVILCFVFMMAFCAIYHNVGLMNAEREKEIGIYLTNGANPFWIRRLMFCELVIYTFYCSIWGGLMSLLVVVGVNNAGLYPDDIPTRFMMACSHFTIDNRWESYLVSFLIILSLMIIGSFGPIWRATENTRVNELLLRN